MPTATLRPERSQNEGAIDPLEEKEDSCTHIAVKNQNQSNYTKATGASRLHDLLRCHHRPNGKGVHMPVGEDRKLGKHSVEEKKKKKKKSQLSTLAGLYTPFSREKRYQFSIPREP